LEPYDNDNRDEVLKTIQSTIENCEKAQLKFSEGSPQHSLLRNRIKALEISKALMSEQHVSVGYSDEEIMGALTPLNSVISKCTKAVEKFSEGTAPYTRFKKLIHAMEMSIQVLEDELNRR
jgi:hypothetical protein